MNSSSRKLIIGTGLLCLIVGFWLIGLDFEPAPQMLSHISWADPIFFIAPATLAMTLLVPKTPVSIVSGVLFGWPLGTLLMVVVALLAATTNYYLGYFFFRSTIDRLALTSKHRSWLPALRKTTKEGSTKHHFLVRLTPIPTAMISYIMGAAGSNWRPFLQGTALAVIPQSVWVRVGADYEKVDSASISSIKTFSFILSIIAAILTSIYVAKVARRELKSTEVINHLSK